MVDATSMHRYTDTTERVAQALLAYARDRLRLNPVHHRQPSALVAARDAWRRFGDRTGRPRVAATEQAHSSIDSPPR